MSMELVPAFRKDEAVLEEAVLDDAIHAETAPGAGGVRRWLTALRDGEFTPFELAVAGGPWMACGGSGGGRSGGGS